MVLMLVWGLMGFQGLVGTAEGCVRGSDYELAGGWRREEAFEGTVNVYIKQKGGTMINQIRYFLGIYMG